MINNSKKILDLDEQIFEMRKVVLTKLLGLRNHEFTEEFLISLLVNGFTDKQIIREVKRIQKNKFEFSLTFRRR